MFAYGQTGSGKTYTMSGPCDEGGEPLDQHEKRGITQRTLQHLFATTERQARLAAGSLEIKVKVSYLEIYNETLMDLINPNQVTHTQG